MNLFLKTIFLLCATTFYAQPPANRPISEILISGTILDKDSKTPLEYATISLKSKRNPEKVFGGITDFDGNFSINIPRGMYSITFEYISFEPLSMENILLEANKNFGQILLVEDVAKLNEVEVVGEKTEVVFRLDKKIYNIGKDITVRGGSVADVLDNIPSVSVDVDGTVALRGNDDVRILINGKPSGLVGLSGSNGLRQIPSESIEKIEVITSPSARYDAEGSGGILNVILKKQNLRGFYANTSLNVGVPRTTNGSVNLNFRTGKFNFFNTTSYRDGLVKGNAFDESTIFDPTSEIQSQIEKRLFNRNRKSLFINLGTEIEFNDKNNLIVSAFVRDNNNQNNSESNSTNVYNTDQEEIDILRQTIENEIDKTNQYSVNYTKKFNTEGSELVLAFQHEESSEDEKSDITNSINEPAEKVYNFENQRRTLYQADYVLPKGKSQFEAGYRGQFRIFDIDYQVYEEMANDFVLDTSLSNVLNYKEFVNAYYTQYGNKINAFSFLLGLRAESTQIEINQRTTSDFSKKNYTNWFPTLNLTYEFNESNSFIFSFSRRIRRPRSRFLNPFPSRTSAVNFFQGNADLNPSLSYNTEIGYLKRWGTFTFNGAVYYQNATSIFSFVNTIQIDPIDQSTIFVIMPINLAKNNRTGVELNLTYNPSRKIRMNGNFNIFDSNTIGEYNNQNFDARVISWFARLNTTITLPFDIQSQTRIFYRGPRANAQTRSEGIFSLTLALNKQILKKKGALSLSASDLLNTRRRRSFTETETFIKTGVFQWRIPSYTLNFNYQFGKKTKKENKRGTGSANSQGGDDGFGF